MGANGRANETDGSRHHPGMLNMRMHVVTPADKVGNTSTCPNEQKWPNLPISTTKQLPDETNSRGNPTEKLGTRMDGHSVTNDAKTANTAEIATPKHSYQWRKVSAGSINVYAPSNAQIAPLGQNFVFGQVEGGDKVMAAREVGERAGNGGGVGNHDKRNGDGDDTTSSGNVDSK